MCPPQILNPILCDIRLDCVRSLIFLWESTPWTHVLWNMVVSHIIPGNSCWLRKSPHVSWFIFKIIDCWWFLMDSVVFSCEESASHTISLARLHFSECLYICFCESIISTHSNGCNVHNQYLGSCIPSNSRSHSNLGVCPIEVVAHQTVGWASSNDWRLGALQPGVRQTLQVLSIVHVDIFSCHMYMYMYTWQREFGNGNGAPGHAGTFNVSLMGTRTRITSNQWFSGRNAMLYDSIWTLHRCNKYRNGSEWTTPCLFSFDSFCILALCLLIDGAHMHIGTICLCVGGITRHIARAVTGSPYDSQWFAF